MSHQFLVTADLSSAEDVDFVAAELEHVPGVTDATFLTYTRLEPLTKALAQVIVARDSGSIDRHINSLVYALNVACAQIPGMYTP